MNYQISALTTKCVEFGLGYVFFFLGLFISVSSKNFWKQKHVGNCTLIKLLPISIRRRIALRMYEKMEVKVGKRKYNEKLKRDNGGRKWRK